MAYLIDGNNLMALNVGWHKDRSAARRRLVHQLAAFVGRTRSKVRVVFDGVPDDEFPEGTRFKSVQVSYARPGFDADARIKELVTRSSYRRDMVVVTSDRALKGFVSAKGARVMSSGKFRSFMVETLRAESREKIDQGPIDVNEWLDYFGDSH